MGNAGKYATMVGISLVIVLLLAFTGAILDVWFALMVLSLLFALGWIVSILPDEMKRTKTVIIVFICIVSVYVFIMPAFIRMIMPANVQRAWETSTMASYTKLATWLYNADARGGRNLEELCRAENYRLTNGDPNSEIGKTMKEIRDLVVKHGVDLEVLMDVRKSPQDMTLDELDKVLKMHTSTNPIDRYRALQQKLQIQRNNAVAEYERCMGSFRPVVKKTGETTTTTPKPSGSTDINIEIDIDALKNKVSGINWREMFVNVVPNLYWLAFFFVIFAIIAAIAWFNKMATFFWWLAIGSAILATVIYILRQAM